MKRVFADLSDNEADSFYKNKKPGETIREYLLRLAKVDAEPRRLGRPRQIPSSLDLIGNPGAIRTTSGDEARKELADVYGDGWKPKKPEGE